MMNNTPNGAKKHRASSNLRDSCSHETAAFFTEQCTSPSLFHRFEVSRGDSNYSLKNYGFLYAIFFTCTHAHKSLSNEM